jgi:N-succinyldiaminopimelate aminotransferase
MAVSGSWVRAAEGAMLLGRDGQLRPSIFAEMSALAVATGSINLGQGFPEEDGPPEVLEAAQRAIADGVNQYPPGRGMPVLLEAIAQHQKRFYELEFDPGSEVLVTAGATEALTATILALTEDGDDVVTFEPFYDSYAAIIALSKARQVTVPLRAPEFQPDLDELRAAVTPRTRLIIVNDPHNPTGSIFSHEVLELVVELAIENGALIVTDEVYEHLTFAEPHIPIGTLPGALERTISISSGGKTFNTTGWKIGWITASARHISAILAVKQFLTYVNGAPFQPAIAVGLGLPDGFFRHVAGTLQGKRDLLAAGLSRAGFTVTSPRGGYFILADAAPLGFTDAAELCRKLPELVGVVGVPVSAFVREDHADAYASLVRFAYCKKMESIERASEQLLELREAK